jgi:hypothetical protein
MYYEYPQECGFDYSDHNLNRTQESASLTINQHLEEAMKLAKQAKALEEHIAYLHGDAFGLKLKAQQLHEKAQWHLDYAHALRTNQSHFMWSMV